MRVALSLLILLHPLVVYAVDKLDTTSKEMARCVNVFAYAANWLLLQDNEGAAKLMLLQQSRATVSLFSLHYEDGRIPGEKVAAFTNEGPKVKAYLDSNPDQIVSMIDKCVATTSDLANRQAAKGIKMWGKSLSDVELEMAAHLRQVIGLQCLDPVSGMKDPSAAPISVVKST